MTTALLEGAGPGVRVLTGPDASPPAAANDDLRGAVQSGFIGLLLRRAAQGYEIVLCHAEAGRSQRIETASDDTDIIALWRSIGRKLGLILLAETDDGEIVEMEPGMAVASDRRYGSPLTYRRPRFLMRRKPGRPMLSLVTSEAEDRQNAL